MPAGYKIMIQIAKVCIELGDAVYLMVCCFLQLLMKLPVHKAGGPNIYAPVIHGYCKQISRICEFTVVSGQDSSFIAYSYKPKDVAGNVI